MDDEQYGLSDLQQLMSTRTGHFSTISQPLEPFAGHRSSLPHFVPIHRAVPYQYTSLPTAQAGSASAAPPNTSPAAATSLFAVDMDCGRGLMEAAGNSRWPRQETLTLLEIRSRLDPKFREANHKGPLWDEVSRILSDEHGYQRSGRKCREKFDNLYKYYKKTKEGKAGRQDGKNYRFFGQLEAIYGDSSSISANYNPQEAANYNTFQDQSKVPCENHSFSISNSSHEFDTSSSENNEEYDLSAVAFSMSQSRDSKKKKKNMVTDDMNRPIEDFKGNRSRVGWREKVKSFVESQMKKMIESQDIWMDNMVKSFEQREQERVMREMEWKKQETERLDREHTMWAKERAWIEARDASLIEALKKFTGQELVSVDLSLSKPHQMTTPTDHHHGHLQFDEMNNVLVEGNGNESDILSLIQLRTGLESSFQECGYSSSEHGLWELISAKMACMGHNLSAADCKNKWENITSSFIKITDHQSNRSKGSSNSTDNLHFEFLNDSQ